MLVESFLEMSANRALLELASDDPAVEVLDAAVLARTHADFCRPFHDSGPILDIVRAQLTHVLDLDDPLLRNDFHQCERLEGPHYRWTQEDLVILQAIMAVLPRPPMLRITFDPSTVRGWTAPEPAHERQKLRVIT